jgi:hypothetical protein
MFILTIYNSSLSKGFPRLCSVDVKDTEVLSIALQYAKEEINVHYAKAYIAEKRYRKMVLAADSFKLHVMRLRQRHDEAVAAMGRIRESTASDANAVSLIG